MKWLVRLYPRVWRQRYGDEFLVLLEQDHLTLLGIVDILMGALKVRLDPARAGGRPTVSALAFMTAALIWFTVPPAFTHFGVGGGSLGVVGVLQALLDTGAVILTLIVVGCAGQRGRHPEGRWGRGIARGGFWLIVVVWLAYLATDGLSSIGVFSAIDSIVQLAELGTTCVVFLGLALLSVGTIHPTVRSLLAALALTITPLLGCYDLCLFFATKGGGAPGWSFATYMALYLMMGGSWLLLGLDLWQVPNEDADPVRAA